MYHLRARRLPIGLARNHNIAAVGQGLARQAVPRFAPHDDGLACGVAFEKGEIFGDVPRDLVGVADDAVLREGDDKGDLHGVDGQLKINDVSRLFFNF